MAAISVAGDNVPMNRNVMNALVRSIDIQFRQMQFPSRKRISNHFSLHQHNLLPMNINRCELKMDFYAQSFRTILFAARFGAERRRRRSYRFHNEWRMVPNR